MIADLLAEYGVELLAFIGISLFVILMLVFSFWPGPGDGK